MKALHTDTTFKLFARAMPLAIKEMALAGMAEGPLLLQGVCLAGTALLHAFTLELTL
jgi:hypothetical protein